MKNKNRQVSAIETSIAEKYERLSAIKNMSSEEAQTFLYSRFVNQEYLAEDKIIRAFLDSYKDLLLVNGPEKRPKPIKCAIALEAEFPRIVLHILSNILLPKMHMHSDPIAPEDPSQILGEHETASKDVPFINEAHIKVITHHSILRDSLAFFKSVLGTRFNKGLFKKSILSEYITEVLKLLCEKEHSFYMENISSYKKRPKKRVKKDKTLRKEKIYKDITPRNLFKEEVLERLILKAIKTKNLMLIPSQALGSDEEFEIVRGKEPVLIFKKSFTNILKMKFFKLGNLPDLTPHRFLPSLYYNPKHSIAMGGVICTSKDTFLSKINLTMVKNIKYLESIPFKINLGKLDIFKNTYMKLIIASCGNYDIREYSSRSNFLNVHFFDKHCEEKSKWTEENYHEFAYLNSIYSKFIAYTLAYNEVMGIGYVYSDKEIFFRILLDSRFRFYYKSWPLSPQSKEEIFNLLSFSNYENIIRLDARASGIQILACILKSYTLLKESGCLEKWCSKDVYVVILEAIQENPLYDYLNRSLVKYTTMKFVYTQGVMSRIRDLHSHCLTLGVKVSSNSSVSLRDRNKLLGKSFPALVERVLPSMCYLLNTLDSVLYVFDEDGKRTAKVGPKTYKLIEHEFGTVIQSKLVKLKKLTKDDKKKIKRVRVSYFNSFENKKREFVSYNNNLVDHSGMARAIIPNTIQSIDALLMHRMVRKARKNSIPIMGRHDCTIVPQIFEKWVQTAYRNNYIRLLESNFLIDFIKENFPTIALEVEKDISDNENELRFKDPSISKNLLDRE